MSFNLKQSYATDPFNQMMSDVPIGYNPVASKYLWSAMYENDPNMNTMADMFAQKTPQEIEMEYEQLSNPQMVEDLPQDANQMENIRQQTQEVFGSVKIKSFNLKKAQFGDDLAAAPVEQMGMQNEQTDSINEIGQAGGIPQPPFENLPDFMKWADAQTDMATALQTVAGDYGDHLKEAMERYYQSNDEGIKGQIAAEIFQDKFFPLKKQEGAEFMAQEKHFGTVQDIVEKLAQNTVKNNNKKSFNLTKTAQHKSLDNAILWGPGQTRIDPFLHQPVSDWHIVERNKGFGLVVDDIWNIDYETIWRENVMDKYSRPYKNKDGEWVGGYIQKRFEVDKNIPETNNMQLKPGQLRRPILPEYGNTESRLQAARAAGDIEGAIDTSKPFNWKEASKKKS